MTMTTLDDVWIGRVLDVVCPSRHLDGISERASPDIPVAIPAASSRSLALLEGRVAVWLHFEF